MITLLTLQLTIFILVAVGFLMKKIHIIGPQGQKNINDLVIYLILPCNILHAFTQSAADGDFTNYLEILLISIGIQVFCVIYGKLMFRGEAEGRYKCLQYGTICSNAGFLGNPIAEGIYGMEGLVLASVYLIPQRIMMWSSGLAVFSGSSDKIKTLKKVVTHPCILACVLGMIMMVTGAQLPPGLDGAVTSVGNCNTAMSMMVIGMILGLDCCQIYSAQTGDHSGRGLSRMQNASTQQNRSWLMCTSRCNASRRNDKYPCGKISGRFPVCYKDGYFFHLTVTSDHLPVEHLPAVKYTFRQQCVQFSLSKL